MGSAIGALWASGYTAAEIAEIVQSIDWQEVFSGRRVRALVPLSRRIDDVPPAIRLRLDGLRPRLPPARDSDYRLNRLLFRLLAERGLRAGGDFDRLPVPFRTVATDLETVQPVVLTRGSLARAVRASMSPPITVPTIEIDGRVLVDGGIVDNVPVDLARGMGADVVVAVDVTSPPYPRDSWGDILGAGRQLIDALLREHGRKWRQDADLVVTPRLQTGAEDFDDPAALIEAGRAAARDALPRLRALAPGRHPRPMVEPVAPPLVTEVVVRGNRRVTERRCGRRSAANTRAAGRRAGAARLRPRVGHGPAGRHVGRPRAGGRWRAARAGGPRERAARLDRGGLRLRRSRRGERVHAPAAPEPLRPRRAAGRHAPGRRAGVRRAGRAPRRRSPAPRDRIPGRGAARGGAAGRLPGGEEIGRAAFSRDLAFVGVQFAVGSDVLLQARADAGRVRSEERAGIAAARDDPYRMVRGLVAWDRLDDPDLPESGIALAVRGEQQPHRAFDGVRDYWRLRADGRAAWTPGGR